MSATTTIPPFRPGDFLKIRPPGSAVIDIVLTAHESAIANAAIQMVLRAAEPAAVEEAPEGHPPMGVQHSERAQPILDLGGPDGGRYWRVVSDHAVDDPDVRAAAVHARVTGSVGCTYNDARVVRQDQGE